MAMLQLGHWCFALLELIFFKFQSNESVPKCFEDSILVREIKSPCGGNKARHSGMNKKRINCS